MVFLLLSMVEVGMSHDSDPAVTPISNEPLYEMDEVVIIASRKEMLFRDTPDIIQIVNRQEIEELRPSSTGEVIEYTSGVSVETGTGSGFPERSVISVNGLPAHFTLVLVDGIRLITEHIHSGQNLEFIPPGSIERLEIMRGAASAQYGTGAIGGIVNIVTRRCRELWSADFEVITGSYGTYKSNTNLFLPVHDDVQLTSAVSWKQSDGIPLKAPTHRIDNMGFNRMNILQKLDIALGRATKLSGTFAWVGNTMEWRGDNTDSRLIAPVLGISHVIGPSLEFSGRVAYSNWDADLNGEKNVLVEPEAHAIWQMAEHRTLMAGVDYKWNDFDRTAVSAPDQTSYGVFLQHEWSDPDRFALMIAARYDEVDDIDDAFSPKLSLMVLPQAEFRLRVSAGRGFHAPTLQELYEEGYGHGGTAYRFGNPDLEPEYSTTFTAGLEADLPYDVQVMLYGFYNKISDMIVPVYEGPWEEDPDINVWRRSNIENAEVFGGEANFRVRMGSGIRVEGGYTVTKNKDLDSGRNLPYSPGSSAHGKLVLSRGLNKSMHVEGLVGIRSAFDREAWNWKPESEAPEDDASGLTTPLADYTKLDAGLTVLFNRKYRMFLKVENILGEDIENLDDVFTVIDGEPVFRMGFGYHISLSD